MDNRIPHWIGGTATLGTGGRSEEVTNPATGEVIGHVPLADVAEVDAAVEAATAAFATWRHSTVARRTKVMFAFRDLIDRHRGDLAACITREHGKVTADALGEVQRGLEVVEFACGVGHLLKGERVDEISTGVDAWSSRRPVGVCAGITPFNFPVMVPLWMAPVAVACGNSFVLKPSEKDPSAAVLLAELWTEAGLPDGVFNVVHGHAVAVNRLLEHPDVAAVSSVSSTPIAAHVAATAAAHGKRVQALGGAKNHAVVLPDADVTVAADAIAGAAFGSAGERCMAISVAVAVGGIADALVDELARRADALVVGAGTDDGVEMGPLVTAAHRERVAGYVDAGVAEGATLVRDGRDLLARPGFFLGACLFDDVRPEMSIYRDEIFGPVLAVVRVDSLDAALALVNANPYANGTAVFTADGGAARRFCAEVEVGMVGVNVPIPVPMAYFSFGGWKNSLYGDLHMHGPDGVRFFTRTQAVTARWPESASGVDTHMPTAR